MKYASIFLLFLTLPVALGCGSSSIPPAQAITPAIEEEIKANDKSVEAAETAQGGLDRRPPQ